MRRFTNFVAAGFITLIIFSCGTSPRSTEARNPETAVAEVASAAVTNIEEELFNVIQDWVKSQNQGDFEKYKSFYAASFSGVKRAGANEYKYDVKGWLKDRERMFQKEMNVEVRHLLINYHHVPYRISFEQLWQSGNFSDYGPKMVKIDSVDGKLLIVSEEMLASRVLATSNDSYNALAHANFFVREGNHITIEQELESYDLIKTTKYCPENRSGYDLCLNIHQHAVKPSSLDTSLVNLLGQQVIFGSIDSDKYSYSKTKEFRSIREELLDTLPGIHREATKFESTFYWSGGERFSEFHSTLFFDERPEESPTIGQWAYVSDTDPIVFQRKKITDEALVAKYYSELDSIDGNDLVLFTTDSEKFLVSYYHGVECGDDYYQNISLWNVMGKNRLFVRSLPDLPVMILDLDKDGDLDILYNADFSRDPLSFISWQGSNYGLQGQDTVFLGCGC
ncbi:hypothetical protein [uncultured Imperialibacter sp.]|uniref:L,D-transpeptidase Cds6 family protein n=1 Tax=uncultured Imperialibacter sp. TaxID=1672639 RepID=UPI0030D838C1|tara:strand:+ start:6276 stop:7628 length:1353 start_codon:yes stop_codon:yes gene_type:complete